MCDLLPETTKQRLDKTPRWFQTMAIVYMFFCSAMFWVVVGVASEGSTAEQDTTKSNGFKGTCKVVDSRTHVSLDVNCTSCWASQWMVQDTSNPSGGPIQPTFEIFGEYVTTEQDADLERDQYLVGNTYTCYADNADTYYWGVVPPDTIIPGNKIKAHRLYLVAGYLVATTAALGLVCVLIPAIVFVIFDYCKDVKKSEKEREDEGIASV